ncbi:hypothetical protein GEMRC1_010526 [Eukaryota sp. GEM-RC1]
MDITREKILSLDTSPIVGEGRSLIFPLLTGHCLTFILVRYLMSITQPLLLYKSLKQISHELPDSSFSPTDLTSDLVSYITTLHDCFGTESSINFSQRLLSSSVPLSDFYSVVFDITYTLLTTPYFPPFIPVISVMSSHHWLSSLTRSTLLNTTPSYPVTKKPLKKHLRMLDKG